MASGRFTNLNVNDDNNNNTRDRIDLNNNFQSSQRDKASKEKVKLLDQPKQSLIELNNGDHCIEVNPFEDLIGLSPLTINLCTFIYSLVPIGSTISGILLVTILFTRLWFLSILYIGYVMYDKRISSRGGQRINAVYESNFWKYLGAYFPIKMRFSTKFSLDSNKNYLLNYTPHGISAFGCVCAFATDAMGFSKLFPGINPRFMVHDMVFSTPFMREFFAYRGDCSVASKSIDHLLDNTKSGSGNLLALVAGGLDEASASDMETLKVVIAKRKGFIKKALISGANLIPCIAFGENSVFKNIIVEPPSILYHIENFIYKNVGFKHPLYYGHGIIPFRRPITVCMGDPIDVVKKVNPTSEDIENLHTVFVTALRSLYEAHSDLHQKFDRNFIVC